MNTEIEQGHMKLTIEIILAALDGEEEALLAVLQRYERYINALHQLICLQIERYKIDRRLRHTG